MAGGLELRGGFDLHEIYNTHNFSQVCFGVEIMRNKYI